MKKVIVTGGTGYIGSHTAVELIEHGYEVVLMDNLSNSTAEVVDGIEAITGVRPVLIVCDLADTQEASKAFEQCHDVSAVIHFAAYKSVAESVHFPSRYYKNNIGSLLQVIRNMEYHVIDHLVFSSSCTVYGDAQQLPVTEETPWQSPQSPYGHTKQLGEWMLDNLTQSCHTNVSVIALRYFNPIGAHPSARIGELPSGIPNNLMPYITQTAVGIRERLRIFGSDYDTEDGTAIRDYIHVSDLALAHVSAVNHLIEGKGDPYNVYNIGRGKGSSVLEVLCSFQKMTQQKVAHEMVDRRPGDVAAIYADSSKAKKDLGWEAKYTLDDMTQSAWRWEQKLRDL